MSCCLEGLDREKEVFGDLISHYSDADEVVLLVWRVMGADVRGTGGMMSWWGSGTPIVRPS